MSLRGIGLLCGLGGLAAGAVLAAFLMRLPAIQTVLAAAQSGPKCEISNQELVERFHRFYYDAGRSTWQDTRWFGARTLKLPLDMWVYQELLYEVKPDVLIECGTFEGGSALFFAHMFDLMKSGRVITIDVAAHAVPSHPRITYLRGSSTSAEIVAQVRSLIKPGEKVLVALDSDHSRNHVLGELKAYAQLVTPGSYVVVEDTNVNGHPVYPAFGPGPMEAMEAFRVENRNFQIDSSREKFLVTFNPRGYLRRVN